MAAPVRAGPPPAKSSPTGIRCGCAIRPACFRTARWWTRRRTESPSSRPWRWRKDFELLVLFTSTPGFHVDVKIAEMMKDANPKLKVAFVGPPVTIEPEKALHATKAIDFIVRREFDHQIAELRQGHAARRTARRQLSARTARMFTTPKAGFIENLDELPWVTKVYKRDLDFRKYNVPFLLNPFMSFYTSRGCPAHVHVLPVAADAFGPSLAPAFGR